MKNYLKLFTLLLVVNSCTSRHPDTTIEWSCGCSEDTTLSKIIDCKQKPLDNGCKIYWNYDCYSSRIIFQDKENEKRVLFTLDKYEMEYSGSLGHTDFQEYKTTFLFTNEVVPGCCTPPEYYLYNKNNGHLIKKLGRAIYVSPKKNLPFVVSLDEHIVNKSVVHSLIVYNLETKKHFDISLPKGDIIKGRTNNNLIYSEHLFSDIELTKNQHLLIKYFIDDNTDGKGKMLKIVDLDLKKYD